MEKPKAHEMAGEILCSKKYAGINRAVVERICLETIPKYAKPKDVIKAVKKELHIIHESFLSEDCHRKAEALLDGYLRPEGITADQDFALQLMALHASTRERLGRVEDIYGYISGYLKADDRIIDMGCGFNPFALPFFTVRPKHYVAYDISSSTVRTLDHYFTLAGLPYRAEMLDAAMQRPAAVKGDVLFMFKLFPLLERQKKGRAYEILHTASCTIVSFPLKSASGREKGMEAFYASQFETGLPPEFAIAEKKIFLNEMFYVMYRK